MCIFVGPVLFVNSLNCENNKILIEDFSCLHKWFYNFISILLILGNFILYI